MCDAPHAETHAIVLPYVIRYLEPAIPDTIARVAEVMKCDPTTLADNVWSLARSVGTPTGSEPSASRGTRSMQSRKRPWPRILSVLGRWICDRFALSSAMRGTESFPNHCDGKVFPHVEGCQVRETLIMNSLTQIVTDLYTAYNNHRPADVAKLYAPLCRHRDIAAGADHRTPEKIAAGLAGLFAAFPDAQWSLDDTLIGGNRAVVTYALSGHLNGRLARTSRKAECAPGRSADAGSERQPHHYQHRLLGRWCSSSPAEHVVNIQCCFSPSSFG